MKASWSALIVVAVPAWACPLGPEAGQVLRSDAAKVTAAFIAEPAPIAAHRSFRLRVRVCPLDAKLVAVDATMPEHRHGMNYRPTLRLEEPGRWAVEGLLLHMAGRWELRFDIAQEGRLHSLRHDILLK